MKRKSFTKLVCILCMILVLSCLVMACEDTQENYALKDLGTLYLEDGMPDVKTLSSGEGASASSVQGTISWGDQVAKVGTNEYTYTFTTADGAIFEGKVNLTFVQIESIAITTEPTKKNYTDSETFDKTGMVVTATYTGNVTREVSAYTVDKTALTVDDTEVTATYLEKTATTAITVSHSWDEGVVTTKATTYKDGVTTFTCTHCNETKTEAIHNYATEFTLDVEATATTNGSKSRHCTHSNCDAVTDVTTIPAHTHVYDTDFVYGKRTIAFDNNGTASKKVILAKVHYCTAQEECISENIEEVENGKYATSISEVETGLKKNNAYVVLGKDITGGTKEFLAIEASATEDKSVTIDLNGHNLGIMISIYSYKDSQEIGHKITVTIKNGTIGTTTGKTAATTRYPEGRDISYGIMTNGAQVDLTVENVTSTGLYGGFYTNGSTSGSTISFTNCNLKGLDDTAGATYLAGGNTATFENCNFEGGYGLYVKSGTTTLTNCNVVARADYEVPIYYNNGAQGTGSGIIVDSCQGYNSQLTFTMNGGSITTKENGGAYAFEQVVTKGTNYSTSTLNNVTLTEGAKVFAANESAVELTGTTVATKETQSEVRVSTIADLMTEIAKSHVTEVVVSQRLDVTEAMTIDLYGKKVIIPSDVCDVNGYKGGAFNVKGNIAVTIINGTIDGTALTQTKGDSDTYECDPIIARDGATVTVNNLAVTIDSATGACLYAFSGSKIIVESGTFTNKTTIDYELAGTGIKALVVNQANVSDQLVEIKGGTFVGYNPANGDEAGLCTTFIADGYEVTETSTGTFVVSQTVEPVE